MIELNSTYTMREVLNLANKHTDIDKAVITVLFATDWTIKRNASLQREVLCVCDNEGGNKTFVWWTQYIDFRANGDYRIRMYNGDYFNDDIHLAYKSFKDDCKASHTRFECKIELDDEHFDICCEATSSYPHLLKS
tara:strand:+ start:188 stop:595 length:408 start_codon:yes stop_codon:yes gene_type:complete